MLTLLRILLSTAFSSLQTPRDLAVENLALRQQLAILMRTSPRPRLTAVERSFWVTMSRLWPGWKDALIIVKPETVVRWHRAGFRLFWRMKSTLTARPGRPGLPRETRDLIRRMARENPTWGAPRIHGELLKLGFVVAERTVQRYMPKRPAPSGSVERRKTFLRNHAPDISAMDFFVVPTVSFRVLYVFVAIHHASRRVLHVNVTDHPSPPWVVQQLREAFPGEDVPCFLIHDRDSIFSDRVVGATRNMGIESKRTSYRSPWQNGIAERWIGSCRRELLDHVVPFGEAHLRRLLFQYVRYYHDDRTHLGLGKDTPGGRLATSPPSRSATVVALPRIGGVHHRYEWRDAA
jgi:transposase InsO family protein